MPFRTRRSVLAAVGVCLSTAGCVADPDGGDAEESTTGDRESTTDDDTSSTGDWIEKASNEPDPDFPVYLNNDAAEDRTVRVWVVREQTGETVFEETRESPAGTEYEMYNLKRADPEGVEAFRVCGELVDPDEEMATTSEATASKTTTSEVTASKITTSETTASETTTNRTTTNETTTTGTMADETTTENSDTRGCATVKTNECYGTAHVAVEEDGSLTVFYSIC